jgi:hypothetical protein
MHRDVRGRFLLWLVAVGMLLTTGGGCSFVKVPQGWMLSTGWSLEFHRMPFNVSCEKPCDRSCAAACEPGCTPNGASNAATPNESGQPTLAPPIEPAPMLRKVEEGEPPAANESGMMNLLKRRGRLGICATCGKLGRFSEPQPAEPSTMPVIAKFHPVPAAPVFCPQPNSAQIVEFQSPASKTAPLKKPAAGSAPKSVAPPAEVIPPPPPSIQHSKSERAPRELDIPPEPPDWVFMTPDDAKDAPAQSSKSSATRR